MTGRQLLTSAKNLLQVEFIDEDRQAAPESGSKTQSQVEFTDPKTKTNPKIRKQVEFIDEDRQAARRQPRIEFGWLLGCGIQSSVKRAGRGHLSTATSQKCAAVLRGARKPQNPKAGRVYRRGQTGGAGAPLPESDRV